MDKQQREAQREAVKVLAIAVGVREAARQLGLSEDRVRQWSKRGQWLQQTPKPQPPTVTRNLVTTVTKPSDALATVLEERKGKTKLHLSKYVEEASEEAANYNSKLKITGEAKDLASVASQLWPEKEQQGSGVMGGLRVYSQQTVIQVDQRDQG